MTVSARVANDVDLRSHFRPDIEGLRAIAVAAVVAFHIDVRGAAGGFAGVDVFYVISGFLITSLLLRDASSEHRLVDFYARRARRLLPAATAAIVGSLAIAYVFASPLENVEVGSHGRAAALFHANIRFASEGTAYHGEADPPSVFLQFWSLSLEEQFYALWPLILVAATVVAWRRARPVAVAATSVLTVVVPVSFVIGVLGSETTPVHSFFLLQYRAWELGIGALLATAPRFARVPARAAEPLRVIGLVAIAYAVVSYGDGTSWPGIAALVPVLGTAAVLVAGASSSTGPSYEVLASPPMQLAGRLSYATYLWHWPLTWAFDDLDDWNVVVYAAVVVAVSALTYTAIEQPVRRSAWLTARRGATLAFGAVLIATGVASTVVFDALATDVDDLHAGRPAPASEIDGTPVATEFVPSDLDPPLSPGMSADDTFAASGLDCTNIDDCQFGDSSSDTVAVLFGDSHAAHWIPALDATADTLGLRVHALVVSGCTPFTTDDGRPNPERCHDEVERAWNEVDELQPDVLILSGRHVELRRQDPAQWQSGVARALRRSSATSTIVLSETPSAAHLVPYCLSEHLEDVRPCEPVRDQELADVNASLAEVARASGAELADLTPLLCDDERCPVIVGNILVYRDADHVTTAFAVSRAEEFVDLIRAALR